MSATPILNEAAVERMVHDFPALQAFHTKHALGPMLAPSCLCCGKSTQGVEIGVRHMELPGVVICKPCHTAAGSIARLGEHNSITIAPDIDERVPVATAGTDEVTAIVVNVGQDSPEEDAEAAVFARPHRRDPSPDGPGARSTAIAKAGSTS
jgi:hypothetical protein